MSSKTSKRRNSGRSRSSKAARPNEFGQLLQSAREAIPDLTQKDVERALGKVGSTGTVSNWETGKSFPSLAEAEKLMSVVKVNLLPAWHRVYEQREAEKASRRRIKSPRPTPGLISNITRQVEALLTDEQLQNLTPDALADLQDVIEDAAKRLRERLDE